MIMAAVRPEIPTKTQDVKENAPNANSVPVLSVHVADLAEALEVAEQQIKELYRVISELKQS
jgi:hypothetical protein